MNLAVVVRLGRSNTESCDVHWNNLQSPAGWLRYNDNFGAILIRRMYSPAQPWCAPGSPRRTRRCSGPTRPTDPPRSRATNLVWEGYRCRHVLLSHSWGAIRVLDQRCDMYVMLLCRWKEWPVRCGVQQVIRHSRGLLSCTPIWHMAMASLQISGTARKRYDC